MAEEQPTPPETILRTPPERFHGLPDYDFSPNYRYLGDKVRLHFVDEGETKGPKSRPVLMMHGEPSWSYLYRHMIPVVAEHARVIAPDLIGFGKSDKPSKRSDYSYANHVRWMSNWFEDLDLKGVVLVCQDWGGLIGLRLVAAYPDRFAGVVTANTFLPVGGEQPVREEFAQWRDWSLAVPEFPAGQVIQRATQRELSPEEVAAYDAPFPDETYKSGARIFPSLVPTDADDPENAANRAAWEVLSELQIPWVTAFSDMDPITRGGDLAFQKRIPGAQGQPHVTLKGGGHFLQEDVPTELSAVVIDLLRRLDS